VCDTRQRVNLLRTWSATSSRIRGSRCYTEPRRGVEPLTYVLRIRPGVSAVSRFLPSTMCFASFGSRQSRLFPSSSLDEILDATRCGQLVCCIRYSRITRGWIADADVSSPCKTSGSRSMSLAQQTVPATESTDTSANAASSSIVASRLGLFDKTRRGSWEISSEKVSVTDPDQCLVLRIDRIEVKGL